MNVRDIVWTSSNPKIKIAKEIEDLEAACRCEETTAALILLIEVLERLADNKEK